MLIKSITLKNFRGYKAETNISFTNLTTFVGKNDIGKSTVLEALDIFFNEGRGCVSLDKDDINKSCLENGDDTIVISVEFGNLPSKIVIDDTNETDLASEYLLSEEGTLKVIKKYPKAGREKIFIKAKHPSNPNCSDLLSKKIAELKKIVTDLHIECTDLTKKSVIRTSIWKHFEENLDLRECEIDVSKEDGKSIWESLKKSLPVYSLFQADRNNSDHDKEVQDPLKEAVKEILKKKEVSDLCESIAEKVKEKLHEVASKTLAKIQEMNPELADSLNPDIPSFVDLKWADLFKNVSIAGDNDIPINKRGSGVKRLILLNFFRAQVERMKDEVESDGLIYAIEEPETSQHVAHQKLLIEALKELSLQSNVQVILTTHSSYIVKQLTVDNIRLVTQIDDSKSVESVALSQLPYPSLNEINFTSFGEISEEYHDELYSYLKGEINEDKKSWWDEYKEKNETVEYIRQTTKGTKIEQLTLTEKIRHQIHHPENTLNERYTIEELQNSIEGMRNFIYEKKQLV